MRDLFDLKGKVAIVTGASRGIGQSIAIELAKNGANVIISDVLPANETLKKIKSLKRKTEYVKADISSEEDVKNLIKQTIKKFKKIDILVNNAGIFKQNDTLNVSQEEWDKTININLKGTFLCCREALKHMKKGSSIINISSIAGIGGYPMSASYCASKGGIRLLTKSLAMDFGPKGIRINSIHPGVIETPMTKGILKDKKQRDATLAKIPLGKTGKPIDIAGPVVFLASDAASYINGAEIIVDGGWSSSL